jgi:LL-diaminopimelate aminotransferase
MKTATQRMGQLAPQYFAALQNKVADLQAAGYDVVRLDVGSPDMPPAPHIIEALIHSASQPDAHGYISHQGPRFLRSAWAELYRRQFGVDLDVDAEIVPLLGSKEGIFHLSQALLEPGDVALVPDPGYPTYSIGAHFAGAEAYFIPLLQELGYQPDFQAVPQDILQRSKLLWLNYPANPTAAIAPTGFFAEALEFARRHDLLVCHDAAYSLVTFDGYQAPSILQEPGAKEVALEFNTLSKSYNMAGWRVGVAVGNRAALRSLSVLKTHADSSHFLPILNASVAAMTGDQGWLVKRNQAYAQRRDVVIKALKRMGISVSLPQASLYVWSPIPMGWTSEDFTASVLEEAQLSLTPGTVFGRQGQGYMRITLTASVERVAEGMQRLENWMMKK